MSSGGEIFFGVLLAAVGAAFLALAMSVQRYGLKTPPPVPFIFGYKLPQFWVWFSGLVIYWAANGLFAVSLIYAPLALLGAIFTTLLVWNLLFGWWLLGEKFTVIKAAGAVLIMTGVALIAIATPTDIPTEYSVDLVEGYLNSSRGSVYLAFLITIVIICVVVIAVFEHKYPLSDEAEPGFELRNDTQVIFRNNTEVIVKIPTSVRNHRFTLSGGSFRGDRVPALSRGLAVSVRKKNTRTLTTTLMMRNGLREFFQENIKLGDENGVESTTDVQAPVEGFVEVSKQVIIAEVRERNKKTPLWLDNIMGVVYPGSLGLDEGIGHLAMKAFMALLSTCADNDECGAAILWGMIMLWLVSSLGTLWWLQTVFRRYDVTQALPIEYGAVMACDALSAIIFYKEDHYMEDWQFALTLVGVVVIILGILVGRYKRAQDLD